MTLLPIPKIFELATSHVHIHQKEKIAVKVQEELQDQISVFTRCGGCAMSVIKQEFIGRFYHFPLKMQCQLKPRMEFRGSFYHIPLNELSMIQYSFHSHHRC